MAQRDALFRPGSPAAVQVIARENIYVAISEKGCQAGLKMLDV